MLQPEPCQLKATDIHAPSSSPWRPITDCVNRIFITAIAVGIYLPTTYLSTCLPAYHLDYPATLPVACKTTPLSRLRVVPIPEATAPLHRLAP